MVTSFKEFIKKLEFPFCYYAYVIDREGVIDYFHYGLWETGTVGLKEAQENLASMMKSLIPTGSNRILDVGCGLGRTTRDLAAQGYSIIGISPDRRLMEMAKAKYYECAPLLVISSFEDYKSTDLFDVILFQESAQYVKDLKFLFLHCKELLIEPGYVLMCDEIRYKNSQDYSFHEKMEIIKTASDCGFTVVLNKDISDKVLETRNFALRSFVENRDAIITEFSSIRENAKQEVEFLIEGWKRHSSMFERKMFGYEVFLFQQSIFYP